MRNAQEDNSRYGVASVVGVLYAFVVFSISFNYSYDAIYGFGPAFCLLFGLTTFLVTFFAGRSDPLVLALCINAAPLLAWYVAVPDQLAFYIQILIAITVSAAAAYLARPAARLLRRWRPPS